MKRIKKIIFLTANFFFLRGKINFDMLVKSEATNGTLHAYEPGKEKIISSVFLTLLDSNLRHMILVSYVSDSNQTAI